MPKKSISGYFLFTLATILALTVLIFKGSPAPFFTIPFVILGAGFAIVLLLTAILYFVKFCHSKENRNFILPTIHFFAGLIIIFYMLNQLSFKWEEIPIATFNEEKSKLLKEKPELFEYGFGDTDKLKNVEKAVFKDGEKIFSAELNYPAQIGKNIKIFVTGQGEKFLITKSEYLFWLAFFASLLSVIMFIFAIIIKKENK